MKELEHQDLLLAVWTDPTPGFYSAVGWDEFGRSTLPVQIHMPFDDPRFVGYIDHLDELNPEELQYVGARLFDTLFQGELLRLYIHLREQTRPTETRLLIRLKIDPPNVARLPWECLYDTRRATFLGNSPETTLVRFVEQTKEPASVPLEVPLKVLLAAEFADDRDAPTLFKLFYDSAQPIFSYSAKSPLPVYVSLSDLPAGAELLDFVAEGFDRKLFLSDLEEGRFLFLMDGLDEMSAGSSRRLTEELNTFMRRFSLNRFVAAARRPVPLSLDIPNWFELLPFAEWEAADFLVEGEAMRVEQARVLYRQLVQTMGSRGGNAQVLAMARRLWREGSSVPYTRSGLYQAFFQVAGQSLSPEIREIVLPALALRMSRAGRTSLRREHLESGVGESDGWFESRFGPTSSEELLAALSKTRLLRGPHAFSFPNVAIQEFLTAYALRSNSTSEILELVDAAEWIHDSSLDDRPHNLKRGSFHGALAFLSGMLEDSSDLVKGLLERDLVLASECHREARSAGSAAPDLHQAIERSLGSGGEIHQHIGCLCLESLGDAWAVKLLERAAADETLAPRVQALVALGTLRFYSSFPLLQAAAKESDPDVARVAQDALARIKAG